MDPVTRIAEALERLSPPPAPAADPASQLAWRWNGAALEPARFDPLPLDLLTGIERQRDEVVANLRRLGEGHAAHDMLLWGARGTGKSALVKGALAALAADGLPLHLIETEVDHIATLPRLFGLLRASEAHRYLLFIDDIAFTGEDPAARRVRSMLEGGAEARPANVRLAVTSNRRAIVERHMSEQDDPVNPRDVLEDRLALADRFGLKLGFQASGQEDWLAMVRRYAAHYGLAYDEADALSFAQSRGGRSGRVAWHYVVELAGRAGRAL